MLKRIMAVVLAAVLSLSVFTACGEKTVKFEPSLTINGKKVDINGLSLMTINGYEVPFELYRYYYLNFDYSNYSKGDSSYWKTGDKSEQFNALKDTVLYYLKETYWAYELAKKYELELTDEDLEEVQERYDEEKEGYETDEEFAEALSYIYLTPNLLWDLLENSVLSQSIYDRLYGEGGKLYKSEDDIKTLVDTEFVRVHHVLISFDHYEGDAKYEDATEEELKNAALELAQKLQQKIENGDSVYDLAQTYGDDPGMENNKDGYLFSYGYMVEEFEEASFELQVGEISEIVESEFGYHIIQRLEIDKEQVNEDIKDITEEYNQSQFNREVNEIIENFDIEYHEYYDQMIATSIQ